jgi:hypothetical protein
VGVIYDYFVAPGDEAAATVIDRVGGPGSPGSHGSSGVGIFRRHRKEVAGSGRAYQTVSDTGIDPVVQCGTLEELLTGRPYEDVEEDPRWGHALAVKNDGERLVLTLTDDLVAALAGAGPDDLALVADPWAQTEEFWGTCDARELTAVLMQLASLARDARGRGENLYCWVCV